MAIFQTIGEWHKLGVGKREIGRRLGIDIKRELYVPRLPKAELCAVAALEAWLDAGGPTGAVVRTFDLRGRLTFNRLDPGDVGRILRRRSAAAGVAGDFG